MSTVLWVGALILGLASVLILGYETHAWRTDEEPTISSLVRRWRGHSRLRRLAVVSAPIFIGLCVVFLGVHFGWDSVG